MSQENKTSGSVTFMLWVLTIAVVALSCWNISLNNISKANTSSPVVKEGYSLISTDELAKINKDLDLAHHLLETTMATGKAQALTTNVIINHENIPHHYFLQISKDLTNELRELGVPEEHLEKY